VENAFKRTGQPVFEKWRPARVILDWVNNDKTLIPSATLATVSKIMQAVNAIFP
jgi:hypothetical protein